MLILGIDTCSMCSSVALVSEEKMLAEFSINHKKTHSERIMPQIENMLLASDIKISDIDAFAVSVGPGSFTGVRIGVATIKAFAQALDKPCIKVSALLGLAHNVSFFPGLICPILDARRDQVYNAIYKAKDGELSELTSPRALALSSLLDELKEQEENIMFVGDGVLPFRDIIVEALGEKAHFAESPLLFNKASSIACVGLKKLKCGDVVNYQDLVPEYVRLSQAEQEKLKKGDM